MKLIALLVVAVLFISACEEEGQASPLKAPDPVPVEVRKTEFGSVQTAVTLAMLDNLMTSITPVAAATNDMSAFPDTTWTNGLRFILPDTAGLVLFSHDLVKNDRTAGTTEYMSDRFTRCKYLATANGDVSWADVDGNPTSDAEAADCT